MPLSMTHEGLVEIFRERPDLAVTLLRDLLQVPIPAHAEVCVEAADLNTTRPKELRADLIVVLRKRGKPVLGIILEVQLARKSRKRWTWPAYLTHLRDRLRCPVCLLVVAPDERVARWCARKIEIGHPGFTLTPEVIGPGLVPRVTDPEVARKDPEVAVLSVMAHGRGEQGLSIAVSLLQASSSLDPDRRALYVDLIYISVSAAVRGKLEEMMKGGYQYQSDFARTYFGKGLEEGEAKGRKAGEAEGEAKGRAASVLAVLEARGLRVSKAARDRIVRCSDVAQLDHWIRRAALVSKTAELFAE
jgi:hypothetical protein